MNLGATLGLDGRELVAFVGAGGKKTAIAHLLETASGRGLDAVYTTTTHTPPLEDLPLVFADADADADADGPVAALAGVDPPAGVAAERVPDPDRATEKVRGFDADTVGEIHASGAFDWLLVKADGARRREFKAPGPDEPVVPAGVTHVVAVASVRAVGRPLDAPTVHRPGRVAAVAGTDVGETVTPETIGRVLGSDAGGLCGAPDGVAVTPLVNKADTPALRERAREAVRVALDSSDRLHRGLVTSFETGYCERLER